MSVSQQQPDGSWRPAEPLPYEPGYDAEVDYDGAWSLFRGGQLIAVGRNSSRVLRALAMWRATRRFDRTNATPPERTP